MRDILCRGKRTDGRGWAYGYYCNGGAFLKNKSFIMQIPYAAQVCGAKEKELMIGGFAEVDPATVGLLTGLTDKYGSSIFEGDILQGKIDDPLDPDAIWRGVVVAGKFGWCLQSDCETLPIEEQDLIEGAIEGNIHDTPNLSNPAGKTRAEKDILAGAIDKWGDQAQVLMVFEEMSELQKELCKNWRGKDNTEEIADEVADVEIMLAQLKMIYGIEGKVQEHRAFKIARLAQRLEGVK